MKKGFTLVELIGVIAVIAILALITIPTVNNTLKQNKKSACNSQKELIRKATKNYASKNIFGLPEANSSVNITIAQLIDSGCLDGNSDSNRTNSGIKNPTTDEYIPLTATVTIKNVGTSTSANYTYTVNNINCD